MKKAWLGLGSNLGTREDFLDEAVRNLQLFPEIISCRCSKIVESLPFDGSDQPDYLNMVVEILTTADPWELLALCRSLEETAGRYRNPSNQWGPRTLDVDILLFGDEIVDDSDLKIPHPGLLLRPFVVVPLAELDSNLRHPVTLERYSDLAKVMLPQVRLYERVME